MDGNRRRRFVLAGAVFMALLICIYAGCFLLPAMAQSAETQGKGGGNRDLSEKDKVRRADDPCLSWVKIDVPVRAVLLCVHGLGLYSSSWTKFGQEMSALGVATYAVDVQGFGSFVKAKGHDKCDFRLCVKNVQETLKWLHKANPDRTVCLMGESMGGAIVLHVAAQSPELMDGVISVCSSGDRFKQKKTDVTVFVHMLLGPRRKFKIGDKIVDQAAEDNPRLKKAWEGDALDQMKLSPLELMQFQHFMNENHEEADKITRTPVLMVQGSEDPLVKPEGTEELFDELKTEDKQIVMVENARHLIFEEGQFSPESLSLVSDWIFEHCPSVQAHALTFKEAMQEARVNIAAERFPAALRQLKMALALSPSDADANYLMGLVQIRLRQPFLARQHLIRARRLGQGTPVALNANEALLTLPPNFVSARLRIPAGKGLKTTAQPCVLVFSANWCKPCQEMNKVVEEARTSFGSKVKFQIVDVDDPANSDLVDSYAVGPLPTTVFLTPSGDLAFSQVGYDGMDGMLRGLQKLIPMLPAPEKQGIAPGSPGLSGKF